MDGDSHKLCGFLQVVVSVSPSSASPPHSLPPGTPCYLSAGDDGPSFRSSDENFLLVPIQCHNAASAAPDAEGGSSSASALAPPSEGPATKPGPAGSSSKRRRRGRVTLVSGSMSVVHQMHALAASRCLRIAAQVVMVSLPREEDGEVRTALLVDVYLPVAVWSGWQFPRSRKMCASFFKHVSCNWEDRNLLLSSDGKMKSCTKNDQTIWNYSDCHALGCNSHCTSPVSSNKKLFDLHEIFKSLPSIGKEKNKHCTIINPCQDTMGSGIWDIADDVLSNIMTRLNSWDLVRFGATCHHLWTLAASVMPSMKLRLFPHQEAAVGWMLKRERSTDILKHPLYMNFVTEDGFSFYINLISGEMSTGVAPTINDFRGGMFCDEPGLGKTVTALSLILKTHGTIADPPQDVKVIWCSKNSEQQCGYYEITCDNTSPGKFISTRKNSMGQNVQKASSRGMLEISSCTSPGSIPVTRTLKRNRSLCHVKKNLVHMYGEEASCQKKRKNTGLAIGGSNTPEPHMDGNLLISSRASIFSSYKKSKKDIGGSDSTETWVQCDACRKWRKLSESTTLDSEMAWFCVMNKDPLRQSCSAAEESWDCKRRITYYPGFYTKGTQQGNEQNISFFNSVLKEHLTLFNSETKRALLWLANLSETKLQEMEIDGLKRPILGPQVDIATDLHGYHKIFQAFGLVKRDGKGISRWFYPSNLDNLAFDATALRIALTQPLDSARFYLSRATLIVVPANLVDHWKTQIQKHVNPGQLRVCIWPDRKKPSAHILAWDYDVVITTFSRLSAEWGPRKRSVLMQVHWLRVILDEGHTLGSSVSLTNKFLMAISLPASSRWILTGTPTPNTPHSQVAHLQPMLKFLHEEAYGQNHESWEAGILRPFEAQMEEGRLRLIQLLQRTMISARKIDIGSIPPCIKKVTFIDFTEEQARSYNELVVTVRRNILTADWNDPSHVESLLNPKQWKFRSNTIRNVRLSCCVAGHIKVTDAGQDIQETLDILVQGGLDPLSEEYLFIKRSLLDGSSCFRCRDWCRLPIITPCRHLLCLDCVALDSEKCTMHGCGNPYEMQSPDISARPENPNPKWPVPKDLIELQPSYKQDDWDPDWQSTSSSKVAYLVEQLKLIQQSNRKVRKNQHVEIIEFSKMGDMCLAKSSLKENGDSCKALPEKVIVFSQFLEHIHVIEQQLAIADITYAGMYSPMRSSNKMESLFSFQHDPNCMVLLMDGSAALGLDLSFVTHVFLMEPIWDRSMEEQVISRAHRMGATRSIKVETLAMRGTIEEQMVEYLQDCNAHITRDQDINDKFEGTRPSSTLHDFAESNYLAQLSFVRTTNKR